MDIPLDEIVIVECAEYEHIEIDADLWLDDMHRIVASSEIDGRDILRVSFRKGVLRLQATSYVGVIPLNDRVVVRVRPRVPIANLTRMVIDTDHQVLALCSFRDYSSRGSADAWIMDLYSDALLNHVDELLTLGLQREYVRRDGEGHTPHGRIEFARTVQRFAARGISNKAAYSWYERSVDTPLNRCVKMAIETIHDYLTTRKDSPHKGDRTRVARVSGHLAAFREVREDSSLGFLDDLQVQGKLPLPDSRNYYRPVLDVSLLILRDVGVILDLGGDDVSLESLLIDTNKLFENFVRLTLTKHALRYDWPVAVLDGNFDGKVDFYDIPNPLPAPFGASMPPLAARDAGKAQPDLVLRAANGHVKLIAEVKNTAHGKKVDGLDVLPDRGEVEQAVTYAVRYGLPFTLLIHPWVNGTKGMVYVGRVRTIDVYDYRLDLSTEDSLDDSLLDMATSVYALGNLALEPSAT